MSKKMKIELNTIKKIISSSIKEFKSIDLVNVIIIKLNIYKII